MITYLNILKKTIVSVGWMRKSSMIVVDIDLLHTKFALCLSLRSQIRFETIIIMGGIKRYIKTYV